MILSQLIFDTLLFFGAGHVFGHLTRNLNTLKIIILLFIGAATYLLFLDMNWVQKIAFLSGIFAHHMPRIFGIILWARDIADFIYAFRYRSAYEDIRRRERELDKREERLRQEERARKFHERERSGAGGDWQEQAKGFRGKARDGAGQEKTQSRGKSEHTSEKQGSKQKQQRSSYSGGQRQQSSRSQSRASGSGETARERSLRILGLDPKGVYTQAEIKTAYRAKAKKTHPDAGGSSKAFIAVQRAWEGLRYSSTLE